MKKFFDRIKPALITAAWLLCASGVIVMLGAAVAHRNTTVFSSIDVKVDESNGVLFIDKNDVLNILNDHRISIDHAKPVRDLDLLQMEKFLEQNPFVANAEVYSDAIGNVEVAVQQRSPILRTINSSGVSYYTDDKGRKMPLSSKFTARVPIATGNILCDASNENKTDSVTDQKLFTLATYIHNNTFLSALTEQIIVTSEKEFEIVPNVGNHVILLGDIDNLETKFKNLEVFYREGLNNTGWNNYSLINLKYENEVYGTRNDVPVPLAQNDTTITNH